MGCLIKGKTLTICLTGATGWLGKSLIETSLGAQEPHKLVAFGRSQSEITTDAGITVKNHKFDLKDIMRQEFDVFAPFAFATRDKALKMNNDDYIMLNKSLIADAVSVIRTGRVGSVLNISSGVLTQASESQLNDDSYSIYANLKRSQEEAFTEACESIGIPLINCRVFSLSGQEMREPLKYAIGNLVNQAVTSGSICLSSKGLVVRRYMDSRDLMTLLLEYVKRGVSISIESSGQRIELSELARLILDHFNLSTKSIIYRNTNDSLSNEYISSRNDFENFSAEMNYSLAQLPQQIDNVTESIAKLRI